MGEKQEILEKLGRILFEEMEHLAPSSPVRLNEWEQIGQWERLLYINCVERLIEERKLIERALQVADDDAI